MANRTRLILNLWQGGRYYEDYLDIDNTTSAKEIVHIAEDYVDSLNTNTLGKGGIVLQNIVITEYKEPDEKPEAMEEIKNIKNKITIVYDRLAGINHNLRAINDYLVGFLIVHLLILFVFIIYFFVMKGGV